MLLNKYIAYIIFLLISYSVRRLIHNIFIYDFFDNIERYIINGERIEDTIHIDELSTDCNSFYDYWERTSSNKEIAKNICNKLVGLYKKLKEGNINYSKENNYKKDFAFLNYWTNWKIYNELYGSTSVSNFYDLIGSHFELDSTLEFVNDYIYDFDKNDLYKMNILYSLYAKYSKLNAVIESKLVLDKESFLSLSIECCSDYNYVSYLCNDSNQNNNSIFCTKLKDFQTKYEELHNNVGAKKPSFSDSLIKLSECPNNKIITTSVIGSVVGLIPLIGVLYKFTPMGQVLRTKMGILNNDISNNDQEMIKMSIMEQENGHLKYQQGKYNIKYQAL